MEFKQCLFKTFEGEPDADLSGIAVYKYGHLLGVICLCCGKWHSAKHISQITEIEGWIDIGTTLFERLEAALEWIETDEE